MVWWRELTAASATSAPPSSLTRFFPLCLPAGIPGCPYFSPYQHGATPGLTPYDAQSAEDKLAYVWSLLLCNQTSAIPVALSTGLIFTESMDPTVHFQSDFMPAGRQKAVHGDGVVCTVRLHIDNDNALNQYTGLLQSGSETAVMRLSSVLDPTVVGGPVPSIAIKFFKSGALSANIVALNSEAPQVAPAATAAREQQQQHHRALSVRLSRCELSCLLSSSVPSPQLETTNPFARPLTNHFVALPQNMSAQ
jgi:hypothetical protein